MSRVILSLSKDGAWNLDLPLFDEEHRAFSAGLKAWLDDAAVKDDESDAAATSRAWVAALAEGGWLRACVPGLYGGIRADLDVRMLCLARERLAYRSALADFAFAMQGLGGGPIALFGSAELKRAAAWLADHQLPDGLWKPTLLGVYFLDLWYSDDLLASGYALQALGQYRAALQQQSLAARSFRQEGE